MILLLRPLLFVFFTIGDISPRLSFIPTDSESEHIATKVYQNKIGQCTIRMDSISLSKKYIVVMRQPKKSKMLVYYATGDLSSPPIT